MYSQTSFAICPSSSIMTTVVPAGYKAVKWVDITDGCTTGIKFPF
jgi:hypothetical protein